MPSKPRYDEDVKKQIIKLHIQDGMTLVALEKEYSVSKATISNWVKGYRKECQQSSQAKEEHYVMERNRQLNRENAELKKEIAFLKKSGGILCEGNRIEQYRFIMSNKAKLGLWWIFRRIVGCTPTATTTT